MSATGERANGRRTLHFETLEDIGIEADRLARLPHRTLGNWSLGQICAHLAMFMRQSLDGFDFQLPAPVRWLARPMRRRFIEKTWPAGLRFPRRAKPALTPPAVSTDEGLAQLHAMLDRLQRESRRAPSPAFGELSEAQWNALHCRHAELHLSFVVPEPDATPSA